MKFTSRYLVLISGIIWLSVGLMLLFRGLNFMDVLNSSFIYTGTLFFPLVRFLFSYTQSYEMAVITLIAIALVVGHFKGRFVFRKKAKKLLAKLHLLPQKCQFFDVFEPSYIVLILFMMGLGFFLRWIQTPKDILSFIAIVVGFGLVQGSFVLIRGFFLWKKTVTI